MRFLWFASIIILCGFYSCKSKVPFQKPNDKQVKTESRTISVLWKNAHSDSSFKFLTKATIYGREIKGILFIKKISDSLYKTSFLAQGALKLFEIDLLPDTFIVHERATQIDKPIVLKTLANDLQLATFESHKTLVQANVLESGDLTILRVPYKTDVLYYTVNKVNELQQMIAASDKGTKVLTLIYDSYENGVPRHFNLKHHRFRLEIDMVLIKE